jgi:hypothetical protein
VADGRAWVSKIEKDRERIESEIGENAMEQMNVDNDVKKKALVRTQTEFEVVQLTRKMKFHEQQMLTI